MLNYRKCYDIERILFSNYAKRIHSTIIDHGTLPLHAIKQLANFGKEEKSQFERALVELQMKMYLTMCGRQQKISQKGTEYGWSSTVFCTIEKFWGEEIFEISAKIQKDTAIQKISERVCILSPNADQKKILRFIKG